MIQPLKWNCKVIFLNKPWALVRKYLRLAPEELSASMMTAAQFLEGCHPYICAASVWHVLSSSGAKRKYLIFICLSMTWNDEWGIIENAWLQKLNFKMKFQYDSPPSNSIFKRVRDVFVGLPLPCRSPAPKPSAQATALCCYGPSSLPFASRQATGPLLLRAFKPAVCQPSNAYNPPRQLRPGTQATALCC